jgi:2-polyprenyl-3-methyl-5-hydroxy-6-metoxy-1,4-benzoquinol methylase
MKGTAMGKDVESSIGQRTGRYSQHANPAFEARLALRTAASEGAFFLPFLRPGMRVLDVGCGPGSITLGLAEKIAPGEIVGIRLSGIANSTS